MTTPKMPKLEHATPEACESILIDIFLLTAVQIEFQTLLSRLTPPPGHSNVIEVPWSESTYYVGFCGRYTIALTMCDKGTSGRSGSILAVADAIARWKPHAVIMAGFAFGAGGGDQKINDILVSTQVIQYEVQRLGPDGPIFRGARPECGQTLLSRLKNFVAVSDLAALSVSGKVHFGAVLSGEKLLDNATDKAALMKAFPDAIGGEMEGAGLYAAADRRKIEWILIKSIADWGVGKTDEHQGKSTENAVNLVVGWLTKPGLERHHFHPNTHQPGLSAIARQSSWQHALSRVRDLDARKREMTERFANEINQYNVNGKLSIPVERKNYFDGLRLSQDKAIEEWLNAYSDICALYLDGKVDGALFRETLSVEIEQLITLQGPHRARLHPRSESKYPTIWRVDDELKALASPMAPIISSGHNGSAVSPPTSLDRYRAALVRFFQQGEKRIWFASRMKFVLDQRLDRTFDYHKVVGLHHAELLSDPSSGPLLVRMRDFNYSQKIDGQDRMVMSQAHDLSIPFDYIIAEPVRDPPTNGYICLSLKARLLLNGGRWVAEITD